MSGGKPVNLLQSDQAYVYDGSLAGFYSCVFTAVYARERPLDIYPADAGASLLPERWIDTDGENANRVRQALVAKVCHRAQELVETVFYSCMEKKELALLDYVRLAFAQGSNVARMLAHPLVTQLTKAEKHLTGEAHLLKGFIRFDEVEGKLFAAISPKNFVLPFLAEHFCDRYRQEAFLIYDKTHHVALAWSGGQLAIAPMEEQPEAFGQVKEDLYRALWKQFYKTISIKERENHRCRRTHMPMRYWSNMLEMEDQR